jgi:hypothetical protein
MKASDRSELSEGFGLAKLQDIGVSVELVRSSECNKKQQPRKFDTCPLHWQFFLLSACVTAVQPVKEFSAILAAYSLPPAPRSAC